METHVPERARSDSASQGQASGGRHVELDWLRTIVVLGTIPFHAAAVMGAERAVFIVSAESSPLLALAAGFVVMWGIPLIFLMSGAATRLALETRSPGAYARERIMRLGVPLVLVALVLSPIQIYFILLGNPSLIEMAPQYGITLANLNLERLSDFTYFYQEYLRFLGASFRGYSPTIGSFMLGHLWFIPRLLVVSLICLPLLRYLRGQGRRIVARITAIGSQPIALLLLGGLAPTLFVALLQPGWLNRATAGWLYTDDWAAFFLDLIMFVYGFLIYSSARLRATVRSVAFPALALGLACSVGIVVVVATGRAQTGDYSLAALLFALGQTCSAWLLTLAPLGLAMRYLTVSTAWQRYLTVAAFPIFVLHGPLLAASAYVLMQTPLPGVVQFLLILVVTVASAFGLYEYVVRRTAVTRLLFGVKAPQPKQRPQ